MLDFLSHLFTGFFTVLDTILPNSPFGDFITVGYQLHLGLGWLNWLIDVGGCATIFGVWLAVGLAATIAKLVFVHSKKIFDKQTNWNGGYTS